MQDSSKDAVECSCRKCFVEGGVKIYNEVENRRILRRQGVLRVLLVAGIVGVVGYADVSKVFGFPCTLRYLLAFEET